MAFRDQGGADQARIQALESDLFAARAEVARLRDGPGRQGGRGMGAAIGGAVAVALAAAVAGAYLGFGVGGRTGEAAATALLAVAVAAGWLAAMLALVRNLLVVAGPHELLVVSGRRAAGPDGRAVGYRVVRGGRVLRVPFIERVDRLDASPMRIDLALRGLPARDGLVSLTVSALVRVSSDPAAVHAAVDRFVGRSRDEMAEVARLVLEGACRAAVAEAPADEAPASVLSDWIAAEAGDELEKVGLELDLLEVLEATAAAR